MRRLLVLVAALFVIGCSSHSAIPPSATAGAAPQVFQRKGGGQWYIFSTHTKLGLLPPIHWYGAGMTMLGSPGLLYIDERGNTTGTREQFGTTSSSSELVGPDGNLWVTDYAIDRITPSGQVTTYVPPRSPNAGPITVGTDGALWFGETVTNPELGRITASGVVTEIPFQPPYGPYIALFTLVTGSDGNFWATGNFSGIDRITPAGVVTNFPIPGFNSQFYGNVVAGPDGAVWFIARAQGAPARYLGRMAMDGTATEFDPTYQGSGPLSLTFTSDGVMWMVTDDGYFAVGSFNISTDQFSAPVTAPLSFQNFWSINPGPDGNLWMGVLDGRKVGVYLRQSITVVPTSLTISAPGMTASVSVSETNYAGNWSGSSKNNSVATIKRSDTPGILTVTAHGVGSTTLDVGDSMHNWVKIAVTVQ
jgi:virginiamycin B lyase